MPLYGGIDLHANNSVVVLLNAQDQVIYQKRLPNHLPTISLVSKNWGFCCTMVYVPPPHAQKKQRRWREITAREQARRIILPVEWYDTAMRPAPFLHTLMTGNERRP